jgi:hypothetical protein
MIQMDMVVTLKNIIIIIFEYYMFIPLQIFPNLCENFVFYVIDVILNFEVLKGKPTKSIKRMPHLKLSKNMLLGQEI